MEKLITLNENEIKVLIQLIDTAVKTLGLQSAEAALVLTTKINQAVDKPIEKVEKESKK